MPLVTQTELEEASTDAQTLEDVVNGAADLNGDGTLTSRLGTSLKTLAKLIDDIGQVDLGEIVEPGTQNLFIGTNAGNATVTGSGNTGANALSLELIDGGQNNSAYGVESLRKLIGGNNNAAFGFWSSRLLTSGSNNTSVGVNSLQNNQSGNSNVAIGFGAGKGTTTHNKTGGVFIGFEAGANENGSNKLYIANSNTATPLIGGDFAAATLDFEAAVTVSQSLSLTHGAERSAVAGAGTVWTASGAGTKDGTAYEAGDVLVTSNVGGTSKTKILMDYSTS